MFFVCFVSIPFCGLPVYMCSVDHPMLDWEKRTQCKNPRSSLKCHELRWHNINCADMHFMALQSGNSVQFVAFQWISRIFALSGFGLQTWIFLIIQTCLTSPTEIEYQPTPTVVPLTPSRDNQGLFFSCPHINNLLSWQNDYLHFFCSCVVCSCAFGRKSYLEDVKINNNILVPKNCTK